MGEGEGLYVCDGSLATMQCVSMFLYLRETEGGGVREGLCM